MDEKQRTYKYMEWIDPQEMYEASLTWFSELGFVKNEQLFLYDLVRSYTLQLAESKVFNKSRKLISDISNTKKELIILLKKVQAHGNQLEIMVDGVHQPKMKKAYKETHRGLSTEISSYLMGYRQLKGDLFALLSKVIKKEKQKRLLN